MSFFKRVQQSLRADAHGLVDALEDEALILKQCLRDAESEVQRKRGRLLQLEADWKRLSAERERAQGESERAERDVELSNAEGREDLARYALKQVLTQQNLCERLARCKTECAEEQKELASALATQQVALEELRARVQAFLRDRETGRLEASLIPVSEEQIELELIRRKGGAKPRASGEEEAQDGQK
jgi:phage shock protein A